MAAHELLPVYCCPCTAARVLLPPSCMLCPCSCVADVEPFAESVRRAFGETFVLLEEAWNALGRSAGNMSQEGGTRRRNSTKKDASNSCTFMNPYTFFRLGSTLTAMLVIGGFMLTVANLGDSDAVLDTGSSILEVTCSHRIQSSMKEQVRSTHAALPLMPAST